MKKASTKMADQEIPELKREQLGKGVRGKYLKNFTQGSNVVVLQPEILKAFPTSEAVNKAIGQHAGFCQRNAGFDWPHRQGATQACCCLVLLVRRFFGSALPVSVTTDMAAAPPTSAPSPQTTNSPTQTKAA